MKSRLIALSLVFALHTPLIAQEAPSSPAAPAKSEISTIIAATKKKNELIRAANSKWWKDNNVEEPSKAKDIHPIAARQIIARNTIKNMAPVAAQFQQMKLRGNQMSTNERYVGDLCEQLIAEARVLVSFEQQEIDDTTPLIEAQKYYEQLLEYMKALSKFGYCQSEILKYTPRR